MSSRQPHYILAVRYCNTLDITYSKLPYLHDSYLNSIAADLNAWEKNNVVPLQLHEAAESRNLEIATWLLVNHGAEL